MLNLRAKTATAAIAIAAAVGVSSNANATLYTFNDPGWVSGSVDTGTGTVILDALFVNPNSVSQTISGIVLTFTTIPAAPSLTSQVSTNGQLISFNNPPPPILSSSAPGVPTNWALSQALAVLTLSANQSCGGPPCDFIIGPPGATGYTAGASIGTHSPFIDGEGKFVIGGITDLLISSIVVQFGSTPDNRTQTLGCGPNGGPCAPPPPGVPLPAALPLFAGGVGLLGFLGWRRKRKMA